jgi:signal transduction histidine kinase
LENGFINAINRFSNRINTLGKINFLLDIEDGFLESDLGSIDKFNLYRIVQEFINNSIKHAQAETLVFKMYKAESDIIIEISDDGIGFELEKVEKGLGIQNLQHRMKMSNIKGNLISSPNNGSKLIIQINKFKT